MTLHGGIFGPVLFAVQASYSFAFHLVSRALARVLALSKPGTVRSGSSSFASGCLAFISYYQATTIAVAWGSSNFESGVGVGPVRLGLPQLSGGSSTGACTSW